MKLVIYPWHGQLVNMENRPTTRMNRVNRDRAIERRPARNDMDQDRFKPINRLRLANNPNINEEIKDLHQQDKVTVPGYVNQDNDPLEADFNSMVEGKWKGKIQGGVEDAGNILKDTGSAVGKLFESLKDVTRLGVVKTANNSTAITGVAGVGAVIAGISSLKNLLKTSRIFFDPKSDKVPWIMHGLQTLLQGGLAFGLASPFMGSKSPFMKTINGKDVVQLKTMIGAAIAPFLLGTFIKTAQGSSVFAKSNNLKEIAEDLTSGVKEMTTNTEGVQSATQAPPGAAA